MLKNKKSENWAFYADDQNRHNAKRLMRIANGFISSLLLFQYSLFIIFYLFLITVNSCLITHHLISFTQAKKLTIFSLYSLRNTSVFLCAYPLPTNVRAGLIRSYHKEQPQKETQSTQRRITFLKSATTHHSHFTFYVSRLISLLSSTFSLLFFYFLLNNTSTPSPAVSNPWFHLNSFLLSPHPFPLLSVDKLDYLRLLLPAHVSAL